MFVLLSKILPPFVYPLGLAALLLAAGLIFSRNLKTLRIFSGLALLVIFLAGNRNMATWLAHSLEWQYLPPDPVPAAEVIVLLGGGTEPQAYPRPTVELNSAGDRVVYAAQLYHQGAAPVILASGGVAWMYGDREVRPAQDMAWLLGELGVPSEAVWLQDRSQNTYEDAVYCAEILREHGVAHILLVTSALHMPRAAALFRAQGLEVTPAPTDYKVTGQPDGTGNTAWQTWFTGLLPGSSSLGLTTEVIKEYFGLVVYRLRGWY